MNTKLRRDDNVEMITGKDKGKRGRIIRIEESNGQSRVIVQSLNMVKKAVKPRRQNEKGGIIDVEAPVHISNVMIVCRKCGPTRVGVVRENDAKNRVCKKCGESL